MNQTKVSDRQEEEEAKTLNEYDEDMEREQEEAASKIKTLIKDTLYNSLAQALIKICHTPYFTLKTFLLIFVIISSGSCAFLVIQLIESYLSYGVSTTTRTLYETPARFPKVTLCNVNPFTSRHAVEFLKQINHDITSTIDIFDEDSLGQSNFTNKMGLLANIYYRAIFKMNSLNETEKRKLSHPLEDLIQNCYFNVRLMILRGISIRSMGIVGCLIRVGMPRAKRYP